MSEEYNQILQPLKELREHAKEVGNQRVISAAEIAVKETREPLEHMFAGGYSRFNKASDAYDDRSIVIDFVRFNPQKHTDGELTQEQMGAEVGEFYPAARSNSGNTYILYPTDDNRNACCCFDKVHNDIFPVCKHEILWLLMQVLFYNRGVHGLLNIESLGILAITDSTPPRDKKEQTEKTELVTGPT
jgi:hypothetical protein